MVAHSVIQQRCLVINNLATNVPCCPVITDFHPNIFSAIPDPIGEKREKALRKLIQNQKQAKANPANTMLLATTK